MVRAWEDETRQAAPYAAHRRPAGHGEDLRCLQAWLEEQVRAVLDAPAGIDVLAEVVEGLPARVLLDRSAGAELLVVGSAAGPASLGPVARSCLLRAPCPVVVVSLQSAGIPARV